MKKRIISLLTCLAIVLSCYAFNIQSNAATKFNITNQSKSINVGQSFQIEINDIQAKKVKWSSSNKSIASVSKKGVVKGKKAGIVTIKGKYKKIVWKIKVNVLTKPKKALIENNQKYEYLGKKLTTFYGKKHLVITFRYTNNNPEPHCFNYTIWYVAYQDGIQLERGQGENEIKMCKDGASLIVKVEFELISKSDVEFYLEGDEKTQKQIFHIN